MKNNISAILASEKEEHSRRLNFLSMLEHVQNQAAEFGFEIEVSRSKSGKRTEKSTIQTDFTGDSMRFRSIGEAVDWALPQLPGKFTLRDVKNLVRGVAPRFVAARHPAGFNFTILRRVESGAIKVLYQGGGAGKGESEFIKTNSSNVVTQA